MNQQLQHEHLLESKLEICNPLLLKREKKNKKKEEEEKTVYDEKNKNMILSVDFIGMQARLVFERHNYTECKISHSK